MYPDWPGTAADLGPLPHHDGPKLKPFDFLGPQQIEFLEYIGEGLHAHIVKVKILGREYALKLFRFVYDNNWHGPGDYDDMNCDLESLSAFYPYSEPFSSECRAFGRLHEADQSELAIACFGYVLLDDAHERALADRFHLEFNGSVEAPGAEDMRSRFVGKSGRPPPIRGIVKALGHVGKEDDNLHAQDARRILRDIIGLQQLGIINLDLRRGQLIDWKFSDLSTAFTVPHYLTTPELNPRLTPAAVAAMEYETFLFSINDYWEFDNMIVETNENPKQKIKLSVSALPEGLSLVLRGCNRYSLRSTSRRQRVYSLVDPRRYDWKASATATATATASVAVAAGRVSKKRHRRLEARPPRWYLNCSAKDAAELNTTHSFSTTLEWVVRGGLIFPMKKGYAASLHRQN